MSIVSTLLLGLQLALLLYSATAAGANHTHTNLRESALFDSCNSDTQLVMCSDIPMTAVAERRACCRTFRPVTLLESSARKQAADAALSAAVAQGNTLRSRLTRAHRTDLDPSKGGYAASLDWRYSSKCTKSAKVDVPQFLSGRKVQVIQQTAPQLDKATIHKIKDAALQRAPGEIRQRHSKLRSVERSSGFIHPGNSIGPAELATMQYRVAKGIQPQHAAKDVLLSGMTIPPKLYGNGWYHTTNTPLSYPGPYAMKVVDIKWSGISSEKVSCPNHYPSLAPRNMCAHIAVIELDAEQAYKQAVAYSITGNQGYLRNALRIIDSWATTNKEWGKLGQNGPLEAGWAVATMSKALELIRDPAWKAGVFKRYTTWVDNLLMPQMDSFVNQFHERNRNGKAYLYNNWHTTIAEGYMAYGVLSNDRSRYNKGVTLYHNSVKEFLQWGKGAHKNGRILGESSETLRDIFHSQFALGGLVQSAEIAWQQNEDLYSSNNYALVSTMELHARIIRAYQRNDSSLLPPGFKLGEQMPPAPRGTSWRFDLLSQKWQAVNMRTNQVVSELNDGNKYLIGIMFLPTGWEVGYNHFAGRLGLKMPETAALLASNWPEWQYFHWGLGSLSHATTAAQLWRPGVSQATVCRS